MFKFNIKKKILIISIIIISILVITILVKIDETKSRQVIFEKADFAEQKRQIWDILQNQGTKTALKIIKKSVMDKKLDVSKCHVMLHTVGHYSYSYDQNLKNIEKLIDNTCYSAYLHGIEAEIVNDEKEEYISILNHLCIDIKQKHKGVLCFHGSGHAFMEKYDNIEKSLKSCDGLSKTLKEDVKNCYGGVFSEFGNKIEGYQTDSGEVLEEKSIINFTYKHPLHFCLTLPEKYRYDCARQLVKLKFNDSDMKSTLDECLVDGLTNDMTDACVNTSSMFFTEINLYRNNDVPLPEDVSKLSENAKKEYMLGAKTALLNWPPANFTKISKSFCYKFNKEKDRKTCLDVMSM